MVKLYCLLTFFNDMRRSRRGEGKSQVAIGFLRNTGTDTPREATRPLFLKRCPYRPLWNTLMTEKINNNTTKTSGPPPLRSTLCLLSYLYNLEVYMPKQFGPKSNRYLRSNLYRVYSVYLNHDQKKSKVRVTIVNRLKKQITFSGLNYFLGKD